MSAQPEHFTVATQPPPLPAAPPVAAPGAAATGAPLSMDRGLRRYMLGVYNFMASGLLLTGLVALGFERSGLARELFFAGWLMRWLFILAPVGFVIALNVGAQRMPTAVLHLLFWGYAASMGVSFSTILLLYDPLQILQAFAATAAGFAGLSLYGYVTRRDLSVPGTFLTSAVTGLVVALGINLYVRSGMLGLVLSLGGVMLFAGLTAVDTQRTKDMYARVAGTGGERRAMVMAALSLYLDFINMFVFILKTASKANRAH